MFGGLLVLGVSARAAAFSALRAGYTPLAADCFRDEDLAAACDCARIDHYPGDFERVAATFPACPWLYTGGLENHPRIVDRIAGQRTLLGNSGGVLAEVRDPFRLAEVLRQEGLPGLAVSAVPPGTERGIWLRKPRKSGGGQRITYVSPRSAGEATGHEANEPAPCDSRSLVSHFYFQQYGSGVACSAVFVAAHGKAVWLGATEQLIGTAWTGARGFEYAGSLGPLETSPDRRTQWEHIGSGLARRFALSGLFGVDAVMTDEAIWVVEVNPRYTASVEVIELACDLALLRPHVRACESGTLPPTDEVHPHRRVGKAIIYAQKQGFVSADFGHFVQRLNSRPIRPTVADIPPVGQAFRPGEPLVTVLAYAESIDEVARSLQKTVASAQAALHCV